MSSPATTYQEVRKYRHPNAIRKIIIAIVAAAAVALGAIVVAPASASTGLQSVAHRGDKQYYPDNSLQGISSAFSKGADWVEIDVHYNPQGDTFFLSHDNSCSGPGGSATIDSSSADTVRANCAIPELNFVIDTYKAQGYTNFIIEFKGTSATNVTGAQRLAALVNGKGVASQVWISSLSDAALTTIRNAGTATKLMRVRAWSGTVDVSASWIQETKNLGFQAANVNLYAWSPARIAQAQSLGLATSGWGWPTATTGDNTDAINLGLDLFMTDRLDDLHQKLGR